MLEQGSTPSHNALEEILVTTKTTIEPTPEMIEAGAKAAWVDYTGRDGKEEWNPDTWPETMLYPKADAFRSAAKACFLAMMRVHNGEI